jgi:phage terminase Nu1 subunit (DNA packaging protein)
MNSQKCLEWVLQYGGTQLDKTTNRHVVAWIADRAREVAQTDAEREACDNAEAEAVAQLVKDAQ